MVFPRQECWHSQAKILEWAAISSSRGTSWPTDQTPISWVGRRSLYCWVTKEVPKTEYKIEYQYNPSFIKMGLNIFVYVQESERKNSKYSFNIVWSTPNIPWKDWCWNWSSNIWPPDVKRRFTGKDPNAGKDWGQEEKGVTESEMVGWHHRLNGHEFEQTPGDSEW